MVTVYRHIKELLTLAGAYRKDGRRLLPEDKSLLSDAAVAFNEQKILWVGLDADLPEEFNSAQMVDCSDLVITPEIVDSHTHLVFGGDRAFEYSMRLDGKSYTEIAQAGGGILNTMQGTNRATRDELLEIGRERIERLASYGIGTIEIKSGYGLNLEKERELTLVIDQLKKEFAPKIQLINTFMPAHAIPKDYSSSAEYMQQVVIPLLEELAPQQVIDCVDIFHEEGYFDAADTELLFKKAGELGIRCKSHADEFNDNKGAVLAARYNALSTDHLLQTTSDGIEALANSSTVATLLPGTAFFLGEEQVDARAFLDAGVKVAIGSDYNPGSCHWDNVLQIVAMSAMSYRLNSCELWSAITLNGAAAVGLDDQGAIVEGLKPRFSTFKVDSLAHITYSWGRNYCSKVVL
jgi:imidazolonepropionase